MHSWPLETSHLKWLNAIFHPKKWCREIPLRLKGTCERRSMMIASSSVLIAYFLIISFFCLLFICTLFFFFFFFASTHLFFVLLLLTCSILNRHYSLLLTHIMYLTTQLSLSWMQSLFALFTSLSHITSLSSYFHTIFCLHIHFFSTYIIRVLPFISNSLLCLLSIPLVVFPLDIWYVCWI